VVIAAAVPFSSGALFGNQAAYCDCHKSVPVRCPPDIPRFTVYDLASYLASGMTEDEILTDSPYLETEDFKAVYEFFASIPERIAVLEASR
jgi:hypothetical protein